MLGARAILRTTPEADACMATDMKPSARAMGSPRDSRITTTIFQGWVRLAFEGMGFEEMVTAPRLHVEHVGGEFVVQHEPGIDTTLAAEHYKLRAFQQPDMYFGALNVAGRDASGQLHALADTRRHGAQFVSNAG